MSKTMLITGTTQGIGNELYRQFNNEYKVITINRRPFEGENFIFDLSNQQDLNNLQTLLQSRKIDILINNAGGATPSDLQNLSIDELTKCTALNYHAPVILMKSVLDGMKERNYGRIINISSIASKSPRPVIPHYAAAKAALDSFTKSMAVAYANYGITINSVCPGGVNTKTSLANRRIMAELSGKSDGNYYNERIKNENGLNRLLQPTEVVALIRYLISDAAASISGQSINICGVKEVH